ncbi:MAG: hypothetical protein DWP97_02795, partial [Calditrichaeota bacterium]
MTFKAPHQNFSLFLNVILFCVIFTSVQSSAQTPPTYRYVQITHHDSTVSFNNGDAYLNEINQVVFSGLFVFRSGGYELFDDGFPATIWSYGHVTPIPHPSDYETRNGWERINNLGQVPGDVQLGAVSDHIHGFIGTTSGIEELGLLPNTHPTNTSFGECNWARATDINDNGMIVGVAYEGDNFFIRNAYPVVFEGGVATKIPHPDGMMDDSTDYLYPIYVNNGGMIAGTNTKGDPSAFYGDRNGLSIIPPANDSVQISEVTGINDEGYVIGIIHGNFINPFTGNLQTGLRHAYVSNQGGPMIDLHTFDSASFPVWMSPEDINKDGNIVGVSSGGAAILWWKNGSQWDTYNLGNLVDSAASLPSINGALSINDRGVILGYTSQSGIRPFLLIPTNLPDEICVNSDDDAPDANPGDGVCSTGEVDWLGEDICTMRAAIMEANAQPGLDTICFRIPDHNVIYPQSELPEITDSVYINGLTQPGTKFVHLNGQQQISGRGLEVTGGFATIRGLMLNSFTTAGLVLMNGDSNIVESCWFGTDKDDNDLGNLEYGIYIENSDGNRIGNPGALEDMNVFAFNTIAGVYVESGEQNRIFTNRFFENDGLGIDLAPEGVNDNDDDDIDSGPNTLLNHPIIDSVSGGILYGTYNGEPNETITVELYRSDSADASGYGEGNEPLQLTTNVNTNANGEGIITLGLSGETLSPGQVFTLLAHDNDNTSEFSLAYPLKKIRVADYLDNPIANNSFVLYRIDGGPPDFPETFIDTITTDAQGIVDLYDYYESDDLDGGSVIKLYKMMDSMATLKDNPMSILPNAVEWHLDNAKFDSTTYAMGFDTLDAVTAQQTIFMNHTLVLLNMVVSIEWEVESDYVDKLEAGLRKASNYLFDVTDGQMALGKVYIVDDHYDWERADLRVLAKNNLGAKAHKNGAWEAGDLHMKVSRQSYGRNEWGPDSSYFNSLDPSQYKHIATIIHEVGHYFLNLGDEYKFISPDERCDRDTRYGFMDNFYELFNSSSSEMSQISDYKFAFCDNTEHYRESGGKSCWQVVDE